MGEWMAKAEATGLVNLHHPYKGIQEVRPGEFYTELWMSSAVDAAMLQMVFDDLRMDGVCDLRFTVHRVRAFERPVSMRFLEDLAQDWPWQTLLLPWRTNGPRLEPHIPDSVDGLWDPAHARELEAQGRILPRINWGNAYDDGEIVSHTCRHVMTVADVYRPMDAFIHHAYGKDDEDAVPGVYVVHEHTTDVIFPVTDNSVVQWRMSVSQTYRETYFNVVGRTIAIRRSLARGLVK